MRSRRLHALVLLAALTCCACSSSTSSAPSSLAAKSKIEASGGKVNSFSRRPLVSYSHVDLRDAKGAEQLLPLLAELPPVHELQLGQGVSDVALPQILRLTELQQLDLSATQITDAGAVQLTSLDSLVAVYLPRGISDETKRRLIDARSTIEIHDIGGRWPRPELRPPKPTPTDIETE